MVGHPDSSTAFWPASSGTAHCTVTASIPRCGHAAFLPLVRARYGQSALLLLRLSHPSSQDLEKQTPWGQSTVVGLNPYQASCCAEAQLTAARSMATPPQLLRADVCLQGAAKGSASGLGRRRLNQAVPALAQLPAAVGNPQQYVYPVPKDSANSDRVQYGTKSVNGAPGSYNHLTGRVHTLCAVPDPPHDRLSVN